MPNAAGIFEHYESVRIAGLPVKCAGEFYIAWTVVGEARVFQAGWFLVMQQPKNSSKSLPCTVGAPHATRADALRWLIDEVAGPFFSDHKVASERLAAWRAKVLPEADEVASERAREVSAHTPPAAPGAVEATAGAVASAFGCVPVEEIGLNPHNPRTEIDEAELAELAESIKAQGGLIQAIAVRDMGAEANPRYRLIAGERRWRAHQLLRWTMIEAKVFEGVDDAKAEEMALIENLQRAQLNPMEEALGFVGLRDRHGYDVEKIAQRTGKAASTIYGGFRLAEMPEDIRALVRARKISPSTARVLAEAARWSHRPAHQRVLADWIIHKEVTQKEAREALPDRLAPAAAEALAAAKLAVDITPYRELLDPDTSRGQAQRDPGSEMVEDHTGRLWHLDPVQWKAEKAELDRIAKKKEAAAAAKAAARVRTALVEKVNVRTEDLAAGKLKYAVLVGDEARYAAHLPSEMVAEGIDEQDKETLVCLKPEALNALKVREAELIAQDTAAKLPALVERAVATVKRIKKIGGREMAFLIDTALRGQAGMQWTALDGKAFSDLGLSPPEDLTRKSLAEMDAVDLARVAILSSLYNSKHGELIGALRWVLNIDDLGLAEESGERREALLAAAASEVFPPVELDPKRLTEWQRAHGLGMPVAEIARSYGVTEADVRGALGLMT